jgi:hypothetical protein
VFKQKHNNCEFLEERLELEEEVKEFKSVFVFKNIFKDEKAILDFPLNNKEIQFYRSMYGMMFLQPKKWEYKEDCGNNYSGVFIFNKYFKFCNFIHRSLGNDSRLMYPKKYLSVVNEQMDGC